MRGRPEAARLCGWRYDARLTAGQMRTHFTNCSRRPRIEGGPRFQTPSRRKSAGRWARGILRYGSVLAREISKIFARESRSVEQSQILKNLDDDVDGLLNCQLCRPNALGKR
jgi:hypothetical protein